MCVHGWGWLCRALLFPSGLAGHGSSPSSRCAPNSPVSPPSWRVLWVLGGVHGCPDTRRAGCRVLFSSPQAKPCVRYCRAWTHHGLPHRPWLEPAVPNWWELPHPGGPSPRADFPLPMAAFPGERRGTCAVPVQGAAAGPAEGLAWTGKAAHAAGAGHRPEVNGSFVFPEKYEGLYSVELTWSPTSHCAADV